MFVIYDLETTDRTPGGIVSIGAKIFGEDRCFYRVVYSDMPSSEGALRVHGITEEMRKQDGVSFRQAHEEFCAWLGDDKVTLVSYSGTNFDDRFYMAECVRNSITLPSNWSFLDVFEDIRRNCFGIGRYTLFNVYRCKVKQCDQLCALGSDTRLATEGTGIHNAMEDVMMLEKVILAVLPFSS